MRGALLAVAFDWRVTEVEDDGVELKRAPFAQHFE